MKGDSAGQMIPEGRDGSLSGYLFTVGGNFVIPSEVEESLIVFLLLSQRSLREWTGINNEKCLGPSRTGISLDMTKERLRQGVLQSRLIVGCQTAAEPSVELNRTDKK